MTDHIQWLREQAGGPMSRDPEHVDTCNRLAEIANELERLAEIANELERLRGIVDKLPKTADGVAILPGMDVWLNDDPRSPRCCLVKRVTALSDGLHSADLSFHGVSDGPWDPADLYSTREAAEAAGGEPCH